MTRRARLDTTVLTVACQETPLACRIPRGTVPSNVSVNRSIVSLHQARGVTDTVQSHNHFTETHQKYFTIRIIKNHHIPYVAVKVMCERTQENANRSGRALGEDDTAKNAM